MFKNIFIILLVSHIHIFAIVNGSITRGSPVVPSYFTGNIRFTDRDQARAVEGGAIRTLTASGKYYVEYDIGLKPTNSNVTAIKIGVSDVLIDLNDSTIFQHSSSSATGLVAIEVMSGVSNVTIKNGVIRGINNIGIKVGDNCNNILFQNIKVVGCNSSISEVAGLVATNSNNIKVLNCEFNNGINSNTSSGGWSSIVSGVKFVDCSECLIQDSIASHNVSSDQEAFGFYFSNCKYNEAYNCKAVGQICSSNDANDCAVGFISSGGEGNLFNKCEAVGNIGGSNVDSFGAGFIFNNNEVSSKIMNCIARANNGPVGDGYGIRLYSGVSFCEIRSNRIVVNNGIRNGYGIRDHNIKTNLLYTNNFAYGNGKADGTIINNYAVFPKPRGILPTVQGTYNDYYDISNLQGKYYNIEIIE